MQAFSRKLSLTRRSPSLSRKAPHQEAAADDCIAALPSVYEAIPAEAEFVDIVEVPPVPEAAEASAPQTLSKKLSKQLSSSSWVSSHPVTGAVLVSKVAKRLIAVCRMPKTALRRVTVTLFVALIGAA